MDESVTNGRSPSRSAEWDQDDVTRRYNRLAWAYDLYDAPMELLGQRRRRRRMVARATGRTLEAGVGTGKNLPWYDGQVDLVAIDVSRRMLSRARRRACQARVEFAEMDVTLLGFDDGSFDSVVATSVFCSVADPVAGLREIARVTKPAGRVLLVEHVRPINPVFGWMADVLSPVTRRIFGFNVNRRTEENVERAGLEIVDVRRSGVWREIEARPREERSL